MTVGSDNLKDRASAGWRHAAKRWLCIAIVCLCALAATKPAHAQDLSREAADRKCLRCHGQEKIGTLNPAERLAMVGAWLETEPRPEDLPAHPTALTGKEPATRPGLYIGPGALDGSVHANSKCIECHTDAAKLPHTPSLNTKTCATECHKAEAEQFPTGAHYEALLNGDPLAPTCST